MTNKQQVSIHAFAIFAYLAVCCSCESLRQTELHGSLPKITNATTSKTALQNPVDASLQPTTKWLHSVPTKLVHQRVSHLAPIQKSCSPALPHPSASDHLTDSHLRIADEYICDGGDQKTRVAVNQNWVVSGLDLEDTIAHYDTVDGRTVVTPSNDVCIYAPRFAAVRKIVRTSEDEELLVMQSVDLPLPPLTNQLTNVPTPVHSPIPLQTDIGLRGALAVRHRTRGLDILHALPVAELAKNFQIHEDFQIVRIGIHDKHERPALEEFVQAAKTWTDQLAPEVMVEAEPAIVETTVERPELLYRIDLEGEPRIRIVKLASQKSALPGEVIIFTLRFDNIGDQTIGNVTIMDNLTTRLEYIPDSAECDLKAEFFTDPNKGESLALRWEIQEPLKSGHGGIIRFRCRVR